MKTRSKVLENSALEDLGEKLHPVSQGFRHEFDRDFHMEVIWPPESAKATQAEDRGLVLRFVFGGQSLVWAGRIGFGVEALLCKSGEMAPCGVLVQGAHSREANVSARWLDTLKPRHLVWPRPDYRYRRPFEDPLQAARLSEDCRVWEQERHGAVVVKMTVEGVEVRPWSNARQR